MTTSLTVSRDNRASDASDLIDPRCAKHDAAGTFAVEWDDTDGSGRREIACDRCAPEVIRYAHLCESFRPPMVTPIDLDLHRPWIAAVAS